MAALRLLVWDARLLRIESCDIMGRFMDMFGTSSALPADRPAADAEGPVETWQERDQQIRTFLSNLPGMAYRCKNDPNWTMEFISKGAFDLTGYTYKELVGSEGVSYVKLIHPADRRYVWTSVQTAIALNRSFTLEYRIYTKSGQEKWVWERGRCIGAHAIEGFISDISERKRYDQAVKEKQALKNQLHQLQKTDSINRMAGAVAHHFNNKLCGVLTSLELVRMQAGHGNVGVESVDLAMEAVTEAAKVSQMMLTCLGQNRLDRRWVDIKALCLKMHASLKASLPDSLSFVLTLPETPLTVSADEEAVRQIVKHLVANAIEAEGATRVELRLSPMCCRDFEAGTRYPIDWCPAYADTFVVLAVIDDGAGMSATMLEQIFDPFYSTKFTGRGIGLPLVLGLTRSHGGGVIVSSKAGEGARFYICLPAAANGAVREVQPDNKGGRPAEETLTILLVEDEIPLRNLATMMIQSLGGHVVSAANGSEALARVEENRQDIDLVFCDIRMPKMDGWHLLSRLRQSDPKLPVIFTTAYDDAAVVPTASSEKPDAILRKPYLLNDIKQMIAQFGPAETSSAD